MKRLELRAESPWKKEAEDTGRWQGVVSDGAKFRRRREKKEMLHLWLGGKGEVKPTNQRYLH